MRSQKLRECFAAVEAHQCYPNTPTEAQRLRAMQRKPRYENVVLCGPRQRSPVAWVNEVISRDGVSCHTLGAGLRVQSPSHVSIRGPPRQFTNRSNMAHDGPRESTTVVLHANLHAGIAIMSAIMTLTSQRAPIPSWQLPLTPRSNYSQPITVPENTKQMPKSV